MSGQDGNRGYLIQTVIAVLESLKRTDWVKITIEPSHDAEKIDILWHGVTKTRSCQVKSSINQINLPDAKRWADELERHSRADELTLILVGPCSSQVARMERYGNVDVPCPKNADFEGLIGLAAHLLDRFLVQENIKSQSPHHREMMVDTLITKLSILASNGSPIERKEFINLIKGWILTVSAPVILTWELVDFSRQRGVENAISGQRLGPADVEACPEFNICKQVVAELKRSHWYSIIGQPGCGKSITAWQAAKKFHDTGYIIWRPNYNADPNTLLKNLPSASPSVIVIDDAQQFGSAFVDRILECSCENLKIIVTSTLAEIVTRNPSCISPISSIDILKTEMLIRRNEILPIVQRFDDQVSDKFMDVSYERRVDDCARQKTPWEFFWVLRGGWRTARAEYESLKQVPNANILLTLISLKQISSCDAGISGVKLSRFAAESNLTEDEIDKAVSCLASMGLILVSDDIYRTKHISYAHRIVKESLSSENFTTWDPTIDALITVVLDNDTPLKGVYWLLDSIQMVDALRLSNGERLRRMREPLLRRCRDEWRKNEWAVGCVLCIYRIFELSLGEILVDKELLLLWFTAGTGRIARFSSGIANHLINCSDKIGRYDEANGAKNLFEEVDSVRLVDLANNLTLADFYSFGDLLGRLAFYRPSWSSLFLVQFNWPRLLQIILSASASDAYAVDKIIGSLSLLGCREDEKLTLKYSEEIIPFVVKAISEDPIHAIASMQDFFWNCLGFTPYIFRQGSSPDERQNQIVQSIISKLDPGVFALAMKNIINRDMETLARSLSIIHEVDAQFVSRVASIVAVENFEFATDSEWRNQTRELKHLLSFFCIGKERQPARTWVERSEHVIEGLLDPMLAGVAPHIAIKFIESGRGVKLIGREQRWNETIVAIAAIADVDKEKCVHFVTDKLQELVEALYVLTLDPPKYMLTFFRLIHELSEDLFSLLLSELDLDDPRAINLIDRLAKYQHNERINYKKLATLASRMEGEISILGKGFLMRLENAM
ncbi:MAG: hypothetical protein JJU05_05035 [Verrucomicrobia bacterium]|nr:hypothetical protein [Verrucomicrobiota bacterium]MCH8526787.1 hypothetical protein [Kiritimatiellia bacterium]